LNPAVFFAATDPAPGAAHLSLVGPAGPANRSATRITARGGFAGISLFHAVFRAREEIIPKLIGPILGALENTAANGRVISRNPRGIAMSNSKSRPEKRRRRSIIAFEMIRLDRTATEPLHEQLYRQPGNLKIDG